mmetsp:Transcript_35486/g.85737  ORF Transcript_35486/g.85737 Transcript_35486/m.85737 type:complete len:169 (+) Transcript_35486:162-668(+)
MQEWERRYGPAAEASPGPPQTPETLSSSVHAGVAGATPGKMEMELVGGSDSVDHEPQTPGGVVLDLTGGMTEAREFGLEDEDAVVRAAQNLSLDAGAASFEPGAGGGAEEAPVVAESENAGGVEGGEDDASAGEGHGPCKADEGGGGVPESAESNLAAEAPAEDELVA